ncbi:hypothetical protein [Stenotrophomonas maltophilia]|uniref:hypothetical protein n=1 Tax=Stenotrophomonas maltophilia TaxID=40324 RepID=UPI0015DF893A|nr:hypothetical protein [Stenotrophomonas maltophilia]MBA0361049.1 hypothetical protein [Stenotrophomonas maltophilia]HEL5042962.1 hypothetical protein [Stenotrophomonas maltophilia]
MYPILVTSRRPFLNMLLASLLSQSQSYPAAPAAPVRRMPARHRTTWAPPGGGRAERARRLRQIEAGTLTAASGLVATYKGEQP